MTRAKWVHKWYSGNMAVCKQCSYEVVSNWEQVTCPKCIAKKPLSEKPKVKVHKQLNKDTFCTECGIPEFKSAKRTNDWKLVDCKTCLRFKPKKKLKNNNTPMTKDFQDMYRSITETGSGLQKKDILAAPENLDEIFEDAINQEECTRPANEPPPIPYERWEEWFKLCCDHSFSPQPDEIWNGAIDTVCVYLRNQLCVIDSLGLSGADEILNKAKKKFKTE